MGTLLVAMPQVSDKATPFPINRNNKSLVVHSARTLASLDRLLERVRT